jgi:hypothetical protein
LPVISANNAQKYLDDCSDLTPYGVAVRYPNELAVDDAIAESTIYKAQIIYNFCDEKVPYINSSEKENE